MDVEAVVLGLRSGRARVAVVHVVAIGLAAVDVQESIADVELELLGQVVADTGHERGCEAPAVEAALAAAVGAIDPAAADLIAVPVVVFDIGGTDSGAKRVASRLANKVRGAILQDGTRDSGCGLKALRREMFLLFPYFDGWHRYLPALAIREGYRVTHIDVVDRNRRHGQSKYGILDRGLQGALDLIGVWWLKRRRKRIPSPTEISIDG